ncbi:MAG TPA: YdcF family protein [Trebonia sp.]|nr:YdcF family protein [Trebonia sp.]
MFALELAVAVFAAFLVGVVREPRSFGNAVLLGLALALGALGLAERLALAPERPEHLLLRALLLVVALGPVLIGYFLIANGVTMIRKESPRPPNLLSLLAGVAVFVVIGLDVAAERAGDVQLSLFATVATLVFGYVSFLLVSYVLYAFLYGLLAPTGGADFVVVLGSGLRPDGGVPPLLANRLERAREVWAAVSRRAGEFRPLLIVSGGQGDDEPVPEASAMASYLIARGFPADRLLLEDESRTTEENLLFSKAIMDELRPAARAAVVTSDFHAFRAALLARRLGIRGQVTGARVAGYYRPSAVLREFAAVFLQHRVINLGICAVLVAGPLGAAVLRHVGSI